MEKRVFGELELAILNIIRKSQDVSVGEVLELLEGENKYTTVMTVMNRLVAKGALSRKKDGRQFRYSIESNWKSFSLFEKWRQKIFGGKSAFMISYLLESTDDITEKEFEQIEKLIEDAKKRSS